MSDASHPASVPTRSAWRHTPELLWTQTVASLRMFTRNPASAFFTPVFPLMFLVVFNLLSSGARMPASGGTTMSFAQYYTPGIAAFGIITACFTSLAIAVTTARDLGILKRVRGTPLPAWIYLAGRVIAATLMALASVVIMTVCAVAFFDVQVVWHAVPAAAISVVLGAMCFCALGLALTAAIPSTESAPPIANAVIFPLLFISGIFFPIDEAPTWVFTLAKLFPIQHLADVLQTDYSPTLTGGGFVWHDLAVLAMWTLAGGLLAAASFRWDPQGDRPRRRPRHAVRATGGSNGVRARTT
jgi:ABC-2 type transport system permease protein